MDPWIDDVRCFLPSTSTTTTGVVLLQQQQQAKAADPFTASVSSRAAQEGEQYY